MHGEFACKSNFSSYADGDKYRNIAKGRVKKQNSQLSLIAEVENIASSARKQESTSRKFAGTGNTVQSSIKCNSSRPRIATNKCYKAIELSLSLCYLLARVEDLSVHCVHMNSCQVSLLASETDNSVPDRRQILGLHCLVDAVSQTGDLVKNVAVAWSMLDNKDDIGSSWNVFCLVQSDAVKLVEDTVG